MTKFARYWIGAEECVEMYSYMHPRGELNELIWILETSREHRLVRGFAAQVNAAIRVTDMTFMKMGIARLYIGRYRRCFLW